MMKMSKKLRFAVTVFFCAGILPACRQTKPIPHITEELSLGDHSFIMILIPSMKFPGGPAGTVVKQGERADILEVEQPFWLARTNTPYSLWLEVYDWAADNGYVFNRPGRMGSEDDGRGMNDRHPVMVVDWSSVMVWCNALTEYYNLSNGTNLGPVYEYNGAVVRDASDRTVCDSVITVKGADGFRLPTGNEWELAARYTTDNPDGVYREYPERSGIYWKPFPEVSGEIEGSKGMAGSERGRIVSVEVTDTPVNSLGFCGFEGKEGKLWQWCFGKLSSTELDTYHLKRGGSRGPRCSRHNNWPKTKWTETCSGYNQITFRLARTANK
jgi:formylglycine-generating enzyme required for sulfatase activity